MFRMSIAIMLLSVLCSCNGGHRITGGDPPQRLFITLTEPVGLGKDAPLLAGGQQARFTAEVTGVNGPFNISWNFGGGADNSTSSLAVAGTSTVDVTMKVISGQQDYTATATVTDAAGVSQSTSVNYQLLGWNNSAPLIEDLTLSSSNLLTVTASDEDGDELSFSLRRAIDDKDLGSPDTVDGYVAVWDLSEELAPSPNDILANGNLSFGGFIATVTDEYGASVESEQVGGNFEAFPLEDDTLYAIATKTSVKVGDRVRIFVATGRPAHPFRYLNSVGVTCESGASYVGGSVDYGEFDDNPRYDEPVDGVWADAGASGFQYDGFGFIHDESNLSGGIRTDFSIIPFVSADFHPVGILFSFEYVFSAPGEYHLGFEAVSVVSRTYYQDSTAAEDHFWSDISNEHPYNTIVVE
ncbi:hypothetical protein KDL44_02005 [bacterium]|nr:hypothetical protein [bacterium]